MTWAESYEYVNPRPAAAFPPLISLYSPLTTVTKSTAGLLGRWRQNGKSNSHLIHIMEIALKALPSFPRQPYVRLPGAFLQMEVSVQQ